MPTSEVPKDKCIVNYLWFDRPEYGSGFLCRDWYLSGDFRAFGVLRKSAEGTSQGLDKYISKLQQEKAKADAEIERKFQAALKLLKN